jgi:hypothetical protein
MTSRASNWPDPVPYSELSERQQEILEFLWNCPSPYSPSFREIGNAVGLTGPSAVRYQIVELERKGWVQRHPGSAATGSPTSARPGTASRAPGRWPWPRSSPRRPAAPAPGGPAPPRPDRRHRGTSCIRHSAPRAG